MRAGQTIRQRQPDKAVGGGTSQKFIVAANRAVWALGVNHTPAPLDLRGRFGFGEGQRIRLSFVVQKVAGRHLLETLLSHDQKVVELPDGWLKVTATVVDSAILA